MSVRLYVGNLPEDINRQDLETAFAESQIPVTIKIITDRKTNKCRGFAFVTVKNDEEADQFVEAFNGITVQDATLKIEKALPRNKGNGESTDAPTSSKRSKGSGQKADRRKSSGVDLDSVQPDPRWASALEQLKERLAAQTTSS
jgi:RNA recognition motif-containing protein